MTTLTTTAVAARDPRTSVPTVSIAGVEWPLYKLQALTLGILLAIVVCVTTQSGELTAWTLTVTTAIVWWARRASYSRLR